MGHNNVDFEIAHFALENWKQQSGFAFCENKYTSNKKFIYTLVSSYYQLNFKITRKNLI